MKLTKLLSEAARELPRENYYDNLGRLFDAAFKKGDFAALAHALGHDQHDPEGDGLSPADLAEDIGWAWDCVRDEFNGNGTNDTMTITELLTWLGLDPTHLMDSPDEEIVALAQNLLAEAQ